MVRPLLAPSLLLGRQLVSKRTFIALLFGHRVPQAQVTISLPADISLGRNCWGKNSKFSTVLVGTGRNTILLAVGSVPQWEGRRNGVNEGKWDVLTGGLGLLVAEGTSTRVKLMVHIGGPLLTTAVTLEGGSRGVVSEDL